MKRFIRKLAAAALALSLAALLATQAPIDAQAGGVTTDCSVPSFITKSGGGYKFDQSAGGQIALTSTATQGSVDFGFEADVVGLAVMAPNTGAGAWFRPGTRLTDLTSVALADKSGMTIVATSVSNFVTGGSFTKGTAWPIITDTISPTGTTQAELNNLNVKCVWLPLRTRGIIAVHGTGTLNNPATSLNVTVNVIGLGQSGAE